VSQFHEIVKTRVFVFQGCSWLVVVVSSSVSAFGIPSRCGGPSVFMPGGIGVNLILYGTPDSGLLTQGHLRVSHSAGNRLLSGGATGPEGSLLILPLLIVSDRDVDLVGSPKKCVVATMVLRENQLIH